MPRVSHAARIAEHEVGAEAHHHVRRTKVVDRLHRLDERTYLAALHRLVLMPDRTGILVEELPQLPHEHRRGDRSRQDAHPPAIVSFAGQPLIQRVLKISPASRFSRQHHFSRAIRIVQIQHRGLHEQIGPAETGWMIGIAFDLDGPTFPAQRQHALAVSAKRHRRGKKNGPAGNRLRRRVRIWHEFSLRPFVEASAQPHQRQRGPHDLQQVPPAQPVGLVPSARPGRELPLHRLSKFLCPRQFFQAAPIGRPVASSRTPPNLRNVDGRPCHILTCDTTSNSASVAWK